MTAEERAGVQHRPSQPDAKPPGAADHRAPTARPDFDDFYRREFSSLVAFARVLSGSTSAEDLAQEAMLRAYIRWDTVADLDLPVAWVRRVCANAAVSAHRTRLAEVRARLRLGARRQEPFKLEQSQEAFWVEVRRLPRRQSQVVALFYGLDLSVAEIAVTLQMAQGTVKTHLSRGRSTLSRRLDAELEEEQ